MNYILREDMNGIPFKYPAIVLPKNEYAKLIHSINDNYFEKYKGEEFGLLHTLDSENNFCTYYFEIRGFGDYNIIDKILD